MRRHLGLALAFGGLKAIQTFLYPDPYLIGDTEEYLLSALRLEPNPYKPIGYSLFVALVRPLAFDPIVIPILQSLLRFLATIALLESLRAHELSARAVRTVGIVVLFAPTAVYLDHFLLADSLFVSLSTATAAGVIAYLARPRALPIVLASIAAAASVGVRFAGIVLPAFALVAIGAAAWRGRRARLLIHAAAPVAAALAVVFALSFSLRAAYGVFRPTTFTGWAFYGNIGPLLTPHARREAAGDDPEITLFWRYLASFPPETFDEPNTNWHRWHPNSPPKELHRIFLPEMPPDSVSWARNRSFLIGFLSEAETPTTETQRLFQRYRRFDDPSGATYRMDHREAFVMLNALLDRFSRAWITEHPIDYVRGFYLESLRRLFFPMDEPINHGRYTYREHPDGSVPALWPGEDTRTWRPRYGDVAAAVLWLPALVVPLVWAVALGSLGRVHLARRRSGRPIVETLTAPGSLLVLFALVAGALVAWGHMMEVRYWSPLLPFLAAGSGVLLSGCGSENV